MGGNLLPEALNLTIITPHWVGLSTSDLRPLRQVWYKVFLKFQNTIGCKPMAIIPK